MTLPSFTCIKHEATIDTSIRISIKDIPFKIDPMRTSEVKFYDRVVGYIKGTREVDGALIADIVVFDPEIIKALEQPPPMSVGMTIKDP